MGAGFTGEEPVILHEETLGTISKLAVWKWHGLQGTYENKLIWVKYNLSFYSRIVHSLQYFGLTQVFFILEKPHNKELQ